MLALEAKGEAVCLGLLLSRVGWKNRHISRPIAISVTGLQRIGKPLLDVRSQNKSVHQDATGHKFLYRWGRLLWQLTEDGSGVVEKQESTESFSNQVLYCLRERRLCLGGKVQTASSERKT